MSAMMAAAGCVREHTAIVLRVAATPDADLQTVSVNVTRADATLVLDRVYDVRNGGFALPGTIAIVARDGSDDRALHVHVAAQRASGEAIERDIDTRFERGRTVTLDVQLDERCPGPTGCVETPCDASAGDLDFRAEFERMGIAPFDRFEGAPGDCFGLAPGAVRDGSGAGRFALTPGALTGDRERCLLYWDASREAQGSEYYYAWSTYLPTGWRVPSAPVRLAGWSGTLEPLLALEVGTNGSFQVALRSGLVDTEAMSFERDPVLSLDVAAREALWHDFVFHVVFSAGPDAGRLEVWYRHEGQSSYTKVADETNFTLQRDASMPLRPSFFVGIDRAPAADAQTVVHDRVRRGRSMESVTATLGCP